MFDNNPFFNSMKSFFNPELLSNSFKNMNNMDFSSFSDFVKKNAEIINETNKKIADNMQSVARRGSQMFQENMTLGFDNLKDTMSSSDMEQAGAKNQQYMRSAIENYINQSKEIIDMVSQSSKEIFETASAGTNNNVNEAFNQNRTNI